MSCCEFNMSFYQFNCSNNNSNWHFTCIFDHVHHTLWLLIFIIRIPVPPVIMIFSLKKILCCILFLWNHICNKVSVLLFVLCVKFLFKSLAYPHVCVHVTWVSELFCILLWYLSFRQSTCNCFINGKDNCCIS